MFQADYLSSCFRLSKSYQAVHSFFTLSSHLMPAYDSQFSAAKERLNSLHEEPDNVTKLKIYALFKQVNINLLNVVIFLAKIIM